MLYPNVGFIQTDVPHDLELRRFFPWCQTEKMKAEVESGTGVAMHMALVASAESRTFRFLMLLGHHIFGIT